MRGNAAKLIRWCFVVAAASATYLLLAASSDLFTHGGVRHVVQSFDLTVHERREIRQRFSVRLTASASPRRQTCQTGLHDPVIHNLDVEPHNAAIAPHCDGIHGI